MSTIDQFESIFRAAARESYAPRPFPMREVMLIADLRFKEEMSILAEHVKRFLGGVEPSPKISTIQPEQSITLDGLIELVEQMKPDLICTYRNLHTDHGKFPYTLGDHVEVLTQVTDIPILLLPHPSETQLMERLAPPQRVLVMTDDFATHPNLIDAGIALIDQTGSLILCHIENDDHFERYMRYIARTPQLDTERTRTALKDEILKEAEEFIEQSRINIESFNPNISVYGEVQFGHLLKTYRALIDTHQISLMVMNTKDENQLAMQGLSYPLAVELRTTPLLML